MRIWNIYCSRKSMDYFENERDKYETCSAHLFNPYFLTFPL